MGSANINPTYGVIAQFADSDALMRAAQAATRKGYTRMDAYSPVPVHGLDEALGRPRSWLGWIVLCAGLTGACVGMGLQLWASGVYYPWNVGGRPYASIPSFLPITFECMVLFSAFTAVFGMFGLNGLPRPHHPVMHAKNFGRAQIDRYLLCIESADPRFNEKEVTDFLRTFGPEDVSTVINPHAGEG
jgi:hypothetical protein